jgi:L-rhamnonate dehydratase
MRRRDFLFLAGAAGIPGPRASGASAKITRITICPIEGRFHKAVAMNSYDQAPKGWTYATHLLRIFTDQGVSGTGTLEYAAPDKALLAALQPLIGRDPASFYVMENRRIRGYQHAAEPLFAKYPYLDSALFDLIGQMLGAPCYELLGPSIRERIEVYDGTVYFSDVMLPEKGVRAVVEEAEEAVRSGYRGVKMKTGRNSKWVPGEPGIQRDIAAVNEVRRAIGPDMKLMADANNGYRGDFDGMWRFLAETQKSNLYWIEEPFPQDPALYARLREKMQQAGMKTLLADGEDMRSLEALRPYLSPRSIDVSQIDIRRGGFVMNREAAELSRGHGVLCVPHNWGSQIGFLMSLHLAKSVAGAVAAEDDRSTCDALTAEGYEFRDGSCTVSRQPGLSVWVNEKVYREKYQSREIVV